MTYPSMMIGRRPTLNADASEATLVEIVMQGEHGVRVAGREGSGLEAVDEC